MATARMNGLRAAAFTHAAGTAPAPTLQENLTTSSKVQTTTAEHAQARKAPASRLIVPHAGFALLVRAMQT
jgi:hypothetical protein